MIKVQKKVSGSFCSLASTQASSRIRGYVSTMCKQAPPLLAALQVIFAIILFFLYSSKPKVVTI